MNQNQVKQKLKALNTSACQQIITDTLKYIGEEADETDVTEEEYGLACRRIVQVLKGRYNQSLQIKEKKVHQVTLEEAIKAIEDGKE